MATNCRYLHRIASDCELLIVPQGLSYAGIAGLPAIRGLYSDFAPLFMYVIFGTLIALIASDCVPDGLYSVWYDYLAVWSSPQ